MKKNCRLCKSENMKVFLDLGHHPHSDQFRKTRDEEEITWPLRLQRCRDCGLVQLTHVVSPEVLYTDDYLYESSITKTANLHWASFVDDVKSKGLKGNVLDIGSNDGTLLAKFKEKGFDVLGIDPCKEVTDIANANGIETITDCFPCDIEDKFDVITGTNVFAHIDDLDAVMQKVDELLKDKGVFIFESPYLKDFLENYEYDTVYHQHLSYWSIGCLIPFFEKFGLEIFDITRSEIHGGCVRVFINRIGDRPVQPIVQDLVSQETWDDAYFDKWADTIELNRTNLIKILQHYTEQGKTIVGVSSPAKGMTLLNYTGAGKYLKFLTDKSKLKQGRYSPGSHLLIKADSDLKGDEVGLLLAWNFKKEIMNNVNLKTWIIPIPFPTIVEK